MVVATLRLFCSPHTRQSRDPILHLISPTELSSQGGATRGAAAAGRAGQGEEGKVEQEKAAEPSATIGSSSGSGGGRGGRGGGSQTATSPPIPTSNLVYKAKDYWDSRFAEEESYDVRERERERERERDADGDETVEPAHIHSVATLGASSRSCHPPLQCPAMLVSAEALAPLCSAHTG